MRMQLLRFQSECPHSLCDLWSDCRSYKCLLFGLNQPLVVYLHFLRFDNAHDHQLIHAHTSDYTHHGC